MWLFFSFTTEWVLNYLLFVVSFDWMVLCLKTCCWISIQTRECRKYSCILLIQMACASFNHYIACFDDKMWPNTKILSYKQFLHTHTVLLNVRIHSSIRSKSFSTNWNILNLFCSIANIKMLIGCLVLRLIFSNA